MGRADRQVATKRIGGPGGTPWSRAPSAVVREGEFPLHGNPRHRSGCGRLTDSRTPDGNPARIRTGSAAKAGAAPGNVNPRGAVPAAMVPPVVRILERLARQPTAPFHEHAVCAEATRIARAGGAN